MLQKINRHQGGALDYKSPSERHTRVKKTNGNRGLTYLSAEKRSTPQQQHGVRSRLKLIFCVEEFSEKRQ